MGMNFPDAPVLDEVYAPVGSDLTYTWDGAVWIAGGTAAPSPPSDYVLKSGDTMAGALHLPTTQPIAGTESTHKQYVDTAIAAKALYQGTWQVEANTPDLDPAVALPLHSYSWIANTVDPNLPETAPAALPGIGGQLISSSDTVIWNGNTSIYELVRSPASVSGDFVEVTGDTMTGGLTIQNAPGNGAMILFPGDATNNGRIDWNNNDGTRKGFIGYAGSTSIEIRLDSATALRVTGGDVISTNGGMFVTDTWHGWTFDSASNAEHLRSFQGKWEFRRTAGVAPGDIMMTVEDGNLSVPGEITVAGMSHLGHVQSSSHIEAVQNVYANSFVTNAGRSVVDEIDTLKTLVETLRQDIAQLKAGR